MRSISATLLRREGPLWHSSGVMFLGPDRLFRRYRETGDPRYLGRVFDRTAPELLRIAEYLTRVCRRCATGTGRRHMMS